MRDAVTSYEVGKDLIANGLVQTGFYLDCEQSFFSDLVRRLHAHASVERRSLETRETRAEASRLQSRA